MKTPRHWKPLQEAFVEGDHPELAIKITMTDNGVDRAEAIKILDAYDAGCRYFRNNLYQVQTRPYGDNFLHINIRRIDGAVDLRDWRHFQQIKNEIVGPECEAVEIYPAESRLVDTSNKFHLWACTDPTFRFPIGFQERDVIDHDPAHGNSAGVKQRPF